METVNDEKILVKRIQEKINKLNYEYQNNKETIEKLSKYSNMKELSIYCENNYCQRIIKLMHINLQICNYIYQYTEILNKLEN